jgi:hypothetical protein
VTTSCDDQYIHRRAHGNIFAAFSIFTLFVPDAASMTFTHLPSTCFPPRETVPRYVGFFLVRTVETYSFPSRPGRTRPMHDDAFSTGVLAVLDFPVPLPTALQRSEGANWNDFRSWSVLSASFVDGVFFLCMILCYSSRIFSWKL